MQGHRGMSKYSRNFVEELYRERPWKSSVVWGPTHRAERAISGAVWATMRFGVRIRACLQACRTAGLDLGFSPCEYWTNPAAEASCVAGSLASLKRCSDTKPFFQTPQLRKGLRFSDGSAAGHTPQASVSARPASCIPGMPCGHFEPSAPRDRVPATSGPHWRLRQRGPLRAIAIPYSRAQPGRAYIPERL